MLKLLDTNTESGLRVISAMARLTNSKDFQLLTEKLENELHRMDEENRIEADRILLRHQQGACQALGDLLKQCKEARELT